jgi:hypothetical protein
MFRDSPQVKYYVAKLERKYKKGKALGFFMPKFKTEDLLPTKKLLPMDESDSCNIRVSNTMPLKWQYYLRRITEPGHYRTAPAWLPVHPSHTGQDHLF